MDQNATPLAGLFERLELAGFDCPPAARVRAWRVLSAIGPQPPNPDRLRLLLAPVFARSAEEQKRFYEIFDRYWESLNPIAALPDIQAETPSIATALFFKRHRQKIIGAALLLLAIGGYALWRTFFAKASIPASPIIEILNAPPDGNFQAGDTVRCRVAAPLDTAQYTYVWSITRAYDSLDIQGPQQTAVWHFPAPAPDKGPDRQVAFRTRPKTESTRLKSGDSYEPLRIACASRPRLPRLSLPAQLESGKPARFALADPPRPGLSYTWELDDTSAVGPRFTHVFKNDGSVPLRFSVRDTVQAGYCTHDTIIYIAVGNTRAALPLKPFEYDRAADPVARFRWPLWTLFALLSVTAVWYWLRWLRRKAPPAPDTPLLPPLPEGWAYASDRPPYYIPFRDQKAALRSAPEQLRLGDALRKRQEGEDTLLDVPATLQATVDGGGYPRFRFRLRTRPSEYLFLVGEQAPGKHLARLFRHLAEHLRGQDVLLDLLWYDPDFRRFWGPALPKGVGLDQLRRLFPQHRLVLLGDAHALLDPFSESTPRLRPGLEAELQGWKERLVLTPQPPDAWNWRERTLYRHFGLFPADLRGLLEAATFVENNLDTEDLPARFDEWQQQQIAARTERPDPNYRRWRTLRDHEDYFQAADPAAAHDLRRWLCAVAVLPSPTWEITLAVAVSLGITPTHNRLLTLARIPWLRDGDLNPRLRRELLAALSEDDERAARTALRDELAAVRPLTADSHAAHELEGALAIQEFLLSPKDIEKRRLIALLLHAEALTRVQEAELDAAAARWQQKQQSVGVAASHPDTRPLTMREWLAIRMPPLPEVPPPPPKPFFTPDFWRAAAATVLALALGGLLVRYQHTAYLRHLAFGDQSLTPGVDEPAENALVAEYWRADSAVIWNNEGVQEGTAIRSLSGESGGDFPAALAAFNHALALRPDYALADQNRVRAWYNWGCTLLNDPLAPRNSLLRAADYFGQALRLAAPGLDTNALTPGMKGATARFPTERLDAAHGQGLVAFYAGQRERAEQRYQQLLQVGYFDTLRLRPNLQMLLTGETLIRKIEPERPDNYWVVDSISTVCFDKEFKNRQKEVLNKMKSNPLFKLDITVYVTAPGDANVEGALRHSRDIRNSLIAQGIESHRVTAKMDLEYDPTDTIEGGSGKCRVLFSFKYPKSKIDSNLLFSGSLKKLLADIDRSMILLKGSTFRMGSEDTDKDASDDEKPAHDVTLRDYYLGRTEVTNAQFAAFLNEKGNQEEGGATWVNLKGSFESEKCRIQSKDGKIFTVEKGYENHPIIYVSWYGAKAFCDWLSQKTGQTYRLPTEAEWEYAARGGISWKDKFKYAGSNNIDEVAWYDKNSYDKGSNSPDYGTHAVAGKKANQRGLYDMSGNVWEWCQDAWHEDYQGAPKNGRAWMDGGDANSVVLRGGSWLFNDGDCRVAGRFRNSRSLMNYYNGFRLARVAAAPEVAEVLYSIGRSMILLKGGTFRMGSEDTDKDAGDDEKPAHDVTLRDYYLGRTEVTNAQFAAFLNEKGNQEEGVATWVNLKGGFASEKYRIQSKDGKVFTVEKGYENHPIIYVTWYGAKAFCDWLSQKTGQTYRLPTEAEWEYAARGGISWKDGLKYAGGNEIEEVAWYDSNSGGTTHRVAGKKANQRGLYDMSGNVLEWCQDAWHENYQGAPKDGRAWMEGGDADRAVLRGGSWYGNVSYCRVALRGWYNRNVWVSYVGFRLARVAPAGGR